MKTSPILLAAINARYSHSGLGARFLLANMGPLRPQTVFLEFTINDAKEGIAARIATCRPGLIGLGVYIWNRRLVEALLPELRARLPAAKIVLGGPEISHDMDSALAHAADCVIRGEGEAQWRSVCHAWTAGRPLPQRMESIPLCLTDVALPVDEYDAADIRHRNIYVETSRGCPFACDFCLSAMESGVRRFPEHRVQDALQRLLDRGCVQFRFVDRSFNTGGKYARAVLDFFLERLRPGLRLHFEMTPDGLDSALRDRIRRFPPGTLHIEAGVQSFSADVLERIHRQGHPDAVAEGIAWLAKTARADVHADLIAGLPGETPARFRAGFDRLYRLGPAEIQVGILKRLHGVPMARHIAPYGMRFRKEPPYDVLETADMDRRALNNIRRFAAHWERAVNRGHFPRAVARMLAGPKSPYKTFDAFSQCLADKHGLYGIDIVRMASALFDFLCLSCGVSSEEARSLLRADYSHGGKRVTVPKFLAAPTSGNAR